MTVVVNDQDFHLHLGDALDVLRTLPDESVHMAVTSPPFFGLRDYGTGEWEGGDQGCNHLRPATGGNPAQGANKGNNGEIAAPFRDICGKCGARRVDRQIGLESTPDEWCDRLVTVFRELRRVLRSDGTFWLEVGDSYTSGNREGHGTRVGYKQATNVGTLVNEHRPPTPDGLKPKDLLGAPWLLAFALRADGWWLRGAYIWARPNPMPESVTDRFTSSHSYVFHLAKSARYYHDQEAVREPHESTRWGGPVAGETESWKYANGGPEVGVRERDGRTFYPEGGRNRRSVIHVPTEPNGLAVCKVCRAYWERGAPAKHCGQPVTAHYAAFPQRLVETAVLAGSSERGVCSVCGAPWVRETERPEYPKHLANNSGAHGNRPDGRVSNLGGQRHQEWLDANPRETTGWRPSCDHDAPTVPATVLDPFLGSGTTAVVARRLGRRCVGIELNADYALMVERRLGQQSLLV